jgi:hypothetical protein
MTPGQFIGTLLASRDTMHLAHWSTRSYAEHKTLDSYYNGILELTDSFVESYMGLHGRVSITLKDVKVENANTHLSGLRTIIRKERDKYESELQNILDEMMALIDKTLYLLTLS